MDHEFWFQPKVVLFKIAIVILMAKNTSSANNLRNETDRLALMNIKLQVSEDPEGVLNSWNDTYHHCHWEGVKCDVRHQRVTNLTLRGKNLYGTISPYIGNLTFLKSIKFDANRFYGEIPREIGRLFRLRNLNLSSNTLSGEIPANLSQCLELRLIVISSNTLVGGIPLEIGFLKKLVVLNLFQNNLTKGIPSSFGNLSSLEVLYLPFNHLKGSLPNEIGSLRNLRELVLNFNGFSGVIPPSIYNISTISTFSLGNNLLEGKVPDDIGLKMPNLQKLYLGANKLYGKIPVSITNATNLEIFELARNKFEGQVPNNLGNLPSLRQINLAGNLLGRNASGDLNFITSLTNCSGLQKLGLSLNYFGGQLPQSIGNLSLQVQQIALGGNAISGTIPLSLTRYANLYRIGMEYNYLTVTIPRDFGKLQSLQGLYLEMNMLTGEIPSALCNLTYLHLLYLGLNKLEGSLPPCLGHSESLKLFYISGNKLSGIISPAIFGNAFAPTELELSKNSFSGSLPLEVGRLANVITFDVSYNNFSGQIPETLGDCSALKYLSMQSNFFQGTIPPKLTSLKGIEHLDLSQNNLTGPVPKDLAGLPSLNYLNLSFNNLEGEVPQDGAFGNSSQIMLVGNLKLCGGIPELRLPLCPVQKRKKKMNWRLLIIIMVPSLLTLTVISTALLYFYRRRYRLKDSSPMPLSEDKLLRISYHELHRATGGFFQENIVGSGNFGVVYKGQLNQQDGKLVAVKVLDLKKNGVSKSFKAECNALGKIRHRNLVSLLSCCSSIDSNGREFKALVYDFMEKGDLDMWLHPETSDGTMQRNLNLLQRLNIAVDVALALQYLHNYSGFTIAHCDLKPSNILLDNDLTAHVGDFGLARLLPKNTTSSSGDGTSSSIAIKGTIGYAAPEYAMGSEASIQGDVYSFGILLLEMFTGKKPTDGSFTDNLNLHNYVKNHLFEKVVEISGTLLRPSEGDDNRRISCIDSILRIGLRCSETSPTDRIDMKEVTRQLLIIKDAFLRA